MCLQTWTLVQGFGFLFYSRSYAVTHINYVASACHRAKKHLPNDPKYVYETFRKSAKNAKNSLKILIFY